MPHLNFVVDGSFTGDWLFVVVPCSDPDKRWSAQELLSHPWLVDVETSAAAEEAAFEDTSNAPRRKNLAPLDV